MKQMSVVGESMLTKMLFVCAGNTCRSPMAEVIARELLASRELFGVRVRSAGITACLLYTSPSPRDRTRSRMPSSA